MNMFLIDIDGYDPLTTSVKTLRLTTAAGYCTAPADTPPDTHYIGRVIQPGSLTREIFSDGVFFGASKHTSGEITLTNADGALDYLMSWGFSGRAYHTRWGNSIDGFQTVQSGLVETCSTNAGKMSFILRDSQITFNSPLNSSFFLGNNVLPLGLEGQPDLKNKRKPTVVGLAKNISLAQVNSSKLIYFVTIGYIGGMFGINVRDKGVVINYEAGASDIYTDVVTAGRFRSYYIDGVSYIKLGTTPQGQITCDVEGVSAYAFNCLLYLLNITDTGYFTQFSGYSGFDILIDYEFINPGLKSLADCITILTDNMDASRVSIPDLAAIWYQYQSYNQIKALGHYCEDDQSVKAVMDVIATSLGAWWGFDKDSKFRFQRVIAPADLTAVAEWTDTQFTITDVLPGNPTDNKLPCWQLDYKYERNHTVQSATDLAGSVQGVTEYQQEYLSHLETNEAIKTHHLNSQVYTINTSCNRTELFSYGETERLFNLFSAERRTILGYATMATCMAAGIDLGVCVKLTFARYGLAAGKNYIVKSILPNLLKQRYDIVFWG